MTPANAERRAFCCLDRDGMPYRDGIVSRSPGAGLGWGLRARGLQGRSGAIGLVLVTGPKQKLDHQSWRARSLRHQGDSVWFFVA